MSRGNSKSKSESGTNGNEFADPTGALGGTSGGSNNGNVGGSDGRITDDNGTEFDGTIHVHPDSRNADGSFRKRRGRKRGSGAGKSKAQVYSDIEKSAEMLTRGLLIFHSSLASITRTPELELDESEAKGLSESGLTLLSLYEIKPDPKLEAAILFAGQVGLTYGTRIVAIRARKAHEKEATRKNSAAVFNADGSPAGTTTFNQEWPVPNGAPAN